MSNDLWLVKKVMIDDIFQQVRQHFLSHNPSQDEDDSKEDSSPTNRAAAAKPVRNLISDQLLSNLHFTLQTPLEHALDLVDKESVTRLVNRSCPEHFVFQVVGNSGTIYTCFPETIFCTCPFFKFSVLRKEDFVMCKHVIAARLSLCLNACKDVEAASNDLAKLLMDL